MRELVSMGTHHVGDGDHRGRVCLWSHGWGNAWWSYSWGDVYSQDAVYYW